MREPERVGVSTNGVAEGAYLYIVLVNPGRTLVTGRTWNFTKISPGLNMGLKKTYSSSRRKLLNHAR